MAGVEQPCTVFTEKNYGCIICHKQIHRGDSGCICSTMRKETFNYASLCIGCATSFDSLTENKEFKPVLKFLLDKAYWDGVGPVVDF